MLQLEATAVSAVAEPAGSASLPGRCGCWPSAKGRVIVSGVGKSGLIARKLAATLTSTGTAASYLHPVDSLHGDLGIVGQDDVAIVLSKSGESEDLFGLVGSLQRLTVPIIAITGATDSLLARVATVTLDGAVTGGGLSPRPGSDREHHGSAGAGRRAGGSAPGGEGIHAGKSLPSDTPAEASAGGCCSGCGT